MYVSHKEFTEQNVEEWLQDFQDLNSVALKIAAKKKATRGYLGQNYFRCQHNTRNWSPRKDPQRKLANNPAARVKNKNYPFNLSVKVDLSNVCTIRLDWEYNHTIKNLEASNFKDLSKECIDDIRKMYEDGHTPSTARQKYLVDLRVHCKNDIEYHIKKADRSITPHRRDFRYIYEEFSLEKYGGKIGKCLKSWLTVWMLAKKQTQKQTQLISSMVVMVVHLLWL